MPDPRPTTLRRPSKIIWIILLLAIVAGGVYAWWRYGQKGPEHAIGAETPPAVQPVTADAGSEAVAPVPPEDPDRTRKLIEAFSSDETFRKWLAPGEWLRRWVVLTDNLAEGVSPRKQLGFVTIRGPFTVVQRGESAFIDPASYRRFDGFADVVAGIDAKAVAKAYQELHAVLQAGYRALGYPGASLDQVTAKALRRIEDSPVVDGDVQVLGERGVYVYADPKLEKLSEVEKQILRMGPRNARVLQAKAREIDRALNLPPSAR